MEGGSFRATGDCGYARATEVLNTKRTDEVVWSVRNISNDDDSSYYSTGIATKLQTVKRWIENYDENAIIYDTSSGGKGTIRKGKMALHEDIMIATKGDEIHCRFQPKLKKFLITFVSSIRFTLLYLNFQKDQEYSMDIKEDLDYFPVIQGFSILQSAASLFKPDGLEL